MKQVEAAALMGISEWTLIKWENGREPSPEMYPSIIGFLGQEPWGRPSSLSEQLRAARLRRGLAITQAAAAMGVDETTFWWWESGGRAPHHSRTKALVAAFIEH